MKVLSPSRSAQVYRKVPETVDPPRRRRAASPSAPSGERSASIGARPGRTPPRVPGVGPSRRSQRPPAGGGPRQRRPGLRAEDWRHASPSFCAREAARGTSGRVRRGRERGRGKTVIDDRTGSRVAGPRRTRVAGAGGGGGGGGGGVGGGYQAPKRKEIIDYDNIDPDVVNARDGWRAILGRRRPQKKTRRRARAEEDHCIELRIAGTIFGTRPDHVERAESEARRDTRDDDALDTRSASPSRGDASQLLRLISSL